MRVITVIIRYNCSCEIWSQVVSYNVAIVRYNLAIVRCNVANVRYEVILWGIKSQLWAINILWPICEILSHTMSNKAAIMRRVIKSCTCRI